MSIRRVWLWWSWLLLIAILVCGGCVFWNVSHAPVLPAQPVPSVAAAAVLSQAIPDQAANAAQLRRGQYLVRTGDCLSCHLKPDGEPFAGGLGLNTPFGIIYSSNISADPGSGIGNWSDEQFYRAMHDGIGQHGERLYPAFPYPWFRRVSRADDDAILAYLKTTKPVAIIPSPNQLPFPFNVRSMVALWDGMFLRSSEFVADSSQSAEWNRGAEIVTGLGHCGACHTPKNSLGADKSAQALHGALLDNFVAPDLTANSRTGIGRWSVEDIAEYLQTGRNAHAAAGGPMADVITYSTSLLSTADLRAIAVYLKSQPARPDESPPAADPIALQRGAAIYTDACSSCHLPDGAGQSRLFPPLGNNAVLQQDDPRGLLHIVLAGSRVGPSPTRPTPLTMASLAWKLDDQAVADVATYVRNSWGNRARGVTASEVETMRKKLGLDHERLTDNSGDHD